METISPLSKVSPVPHTYSTEVAPTYLSFQSYHDHVVYPSTPCSANQRDFSFNINPSASAELHLPSCEMEIRLRLTKRDGSVIENATQVGCVQALAMTMWERTSIRINGVLWIPELTTVDHFEMFKLMGCYRESSRKALFHRAGK